MEKEEDRKRIPLFPPFVYAGGFVIGVIYYLRANQFYPGRWTFLRLLFLLLLSWLLLLSFHHGVVTKQSVSKHTQNIGSTLLSLLLVMLMCEAVFLFVGQSNKNDLTMASKIWFSRHWELNERGYRDAEMKAKIGSDEKKILLLGDSFTSGHGIEDPQDRFGDLLDDELEGWQVLNLGVNGSDTQHERDRLRAWDGGGDLLLLVWFVNDIHEAAADTWMSWETYAEMPDKGETDRKILPVRGSYFLNYLYWLRPPPSGKSYRSFLEEAYRRPEVFRSHEREIQGILRAAAARKMKTAVILFPLMEDLEGSEFAIRPVREFLQMEKIPVLDLRTVLMNKGPADGWVNFGDPHPNQEVQVVVAEALLDFLQTHELVNE